MKKKNKFNKLQFFITIACILSLIFTAKLLFKNLVLNNPIFNVYEIRFAGNKEVSNDTIFQSLNFDIGDNIFRLKNFKAKNKILKNPYIKSVRIRKNLPNKVNICINERERFLKIHGLDKYFFIDKEGYLLEVIQESGCEDETVKTEYKNLAEVYGIEIETLAIGSHLSLKNEKNKVCLECARALNGQNILRNVVNIDVFDLKNIKLNYMNRIFISIGDNTNIEYKIKFIKQILLEHTGSNESGELTYIGEDFYFKRYINN